MTFDRDFSHTVEVACSCADIEQCRTEKYISDVRILVWELDALKAEREAELEHGRSRSFSRHR